VQDLAALAAETSVVPYLVPDREALRRLIAARAAGAEDKLIASAALDGDELVVWSCEPRRYRVAVSAIPALAGMSADGISRFLISESGSRIHWDEGDVDLGIDAFRVHADAAFRTKKEREVRAEARRYAGAIRSLRQQRGLKQSQIRDLSEREVRRIESGEYMPQYASLEKLARAHGLSVDEYVAALASRPRSPARRGSTSGSRDRSTGRSGRLENDPRFLSRIANARKSLRAGRSVKSTGR
jgi:transcriptional regulator with XRE-family HTH domain